MAAPHTPPPQEPWRPGSWAQARLSRFDTTVLTVLLAVMALVRAWDYATPPSWAPSEAVGSISLAVVESAAPMWLWVAWLAGGGLVLAGAALTRIHVGVWAGHALLFVAYVALAAGFTIEYGGHPWADGIRAAGTIWLVAALHLLITIRTGWRPARWSPTP